MIKHTGGCHCGRVRFEVMAPENLVISDCNCSICEKSGHRGLIVPKELFTLVSGKGDLKTYTFNTGVAQHHFCTHCGVKSFYQPRSHPDGISVAVGCLDPGTVKSMTLRTFHGQEWEKQHPSGRAESYPGE